MEIGILRVYVYKEQLKCFSLLHLAPQFYFSIILDIIFLVTVQSSIIILLVDKPLLLVVDNKNDSYEIFEGSTVVGTYSNIETNIDT